MTAMVAPPRGRIPLRGVIVSGSCRPPGKAGMLTVQDVPDSRWATSRALYHLFGRVHRDLSRDRPPQERLPLIPKFQGCLHRVGTR